MSATRPRSGSSIDLTQDVFLTKGAAEVLVLDDTAVLPDDVRLGVSATDEQDVKTRPRANTGGNINAFFIATKVTLVEELSRVAGAR